MLEEIECSYIKRALCALLKFGELASYNHGQETIAEWQREHKTRQIMRFTGATG